MSFFSQSGHWYVVNRDGSIEPRHEFGLADARKVSAFPSITTILKERANPGLDKWKENQLFAAIMANPMREGEDIKDYRKRIAAEASKTRDYAATFGTRLHDALDIYPEKVTTDQQLVPYVEKFAPSYNRIVKKRIASELMLADPDLGVAGKTDLIADTYEWGLAIIDYKTSKFKAGKASFWDSYKLQLAFYAKAYQKKMGLAETPVIINCGINSDEPMEPQWKRYSTNEQNQAYSEFLAVAYLWFCTNNYWPTSRSGFGGEWGIHVQTNGKLISA